MGTGLLLFSYLLSVGSAKSLCLAMPLLYLGLPLHHLLVKCRVLDNVTCFNRKFDMAKRPNDLVTLDVAAILVDKSKSSIRYYLKTNKIKKYYKDPSKKNSPVMVSKQELLAYLAQNALPKGKASKGRPKSKIVSREVIKQERDEAQKEIIMLKAQLKMKDEMMEMLKQHTNDIKHSNALLDKQLNNLRLDLSSANDKNEKLDLRIAQLTQYLSLPWYRRFGKTLPLLTG